MTRSQRIAFFFPEIFRYHFLSCTRNDSRQQMPVIVSHDQQFSQVWLSIDSIKYKQWLLFSRPVIFIYFIVVHFPLDYRGSSKSFRFIISSCTFRWGGAKFWLSFVTIVSFCFVVVHFRLRGNAKCCIIMLSCIFRWGGVRSVDWVTYTSSTLQCYLLLLEVPAVSSTAAVSRIAMWVAYTS